MSWPLTPSARWLALGVAAVTIASVAAVPVYLRTRQAAAAATAPALVGHAVVNSRPAGVAVVIDGVPRGITPLDVALSAGAHEAVLRSGTEERTVTLTIERGTRVVEDVDMPTAAVTTAILEVTSEPSGARVAVDGKPSGQTPLTLRGVASGAHAIAVSQGSAVVNRSVDVAAGATASVFVALGASTPVTAGMFAVEAPVELRVIENGQLLGISNAAPLPVAAGKHQFELVNDTLELRLTRAVTIESGKTARINVPAPNGTLFINAAPWAEVFLDGRSLGVTPLGNVPVAVGSRELVFRHPQFGERRRTVVVGARTPVHVGMEMTR